MHTAQTPQVNRILRWRFLGLALAPLTLLAGCQSGAGTGALAGGALGGLVGNLAGKGTGNRTATTALGAGIGAITGAVVGDTVEKNEKKAEARGAAAGYAAAQPRMNAPSIRDVAEMARSGVQEHVIINQMRATNARYALTAQDIIYLQQNGVTSGVIDEMLSSNRPVVRGAAPTVVYEARPYYVAPAPVTSVGIGYTYSHR